MIDSLTTKDKSKYIDAWKYHISQFVYLGSPLIHASKEAPSYYEELTSIMERLEQLVEIAADEDFKDE